MKFPTPTVSSLIVDSPSSQQSTHTKFLCFASEIEGKYIKHPSNEENQAKWYSQEDGAHFQHVMVKDVMKCSIMLANTDGLEDKTTLINYMIHCTGLDHLISRDVPRRYKATMAAKKEHVRLVLQVQELQRRLNVNRPEDLARVLAESSAKSKDRSYRVAKMAASIV